MKSTNSQPVRFIIFQLLLILTTNCTDYEAPQFAESTTESSTAEIQAISLRALQNQLLNNQGSIASNLIELAGIKRLLGYIIDKENNDLIIFGNPDSSLPPLYLEDFVIALRNAWFKYAPLENNTYIYSHPGCSIDPNPNTMQRLNKVANNISKGDSFDKVENSLDDWHTTCQEQQSVRVLGIPFNTRFAKVMVQADYDMKSLVDGTDSLNVPGFQSLTGTKLEQIKQSVRNNEPIKVSIGGLNRFWFKPGENIYTEVDDVVLIEQCPVILRTEETYLSSKGGYISGKSVDPSAQSFCKDFSELYEQIAIQRPIYRELENLFRFVALAKIIKYKSAHTTAGLDLSYLLEDFPVQENPVSRQLPGRSAVKEFTHRQKTSGSEQILKLWLPSCGGVGIDITVKERHFRKGASSRIKDLKTRILDSRLAPTSLSWPVGRSPDTPIAKRKKKKPKGKSSSRNYSIVRVDKSGADYKVSDSEDNIIYQGNSLQILADAVNQTMQSTETLYLKMRGFSLREMEGFVATYQIHQARVKDNIAVKKLPGNPDIQDAITSSDLKLVRKPRTRIERFTDNKGVERYKGIVKYIARTQQSIFQFTIEIIAKTRQILEIFMNRLLQRQPGSDHLLDDILRIRQELKKEYKLKDSDLDIRIIDEFGNIEIVLRIELNFRKKIESFRTS